MAYQISGTTVINDSRKGIFNSVNVGTSQPGSPSTGDIYYDNSIGSLRVYNGSSWTTL